MIALFITAVALAHGGVDDEKPMAPLAGDDSIRLPSESSEFDAVLVIPHPHPGVPIAAKLLLADFATSAPIGAGTVDLSLGGPGKLKAAPSPGVTAGTWPVELTFPAEGTYTGGLTVQADGRSDLLAVPSFDIHDADETAPSRFAWGVAAGSGLCAGLALGLGLGLALGLGRRAARIAAPAVIAAGLVGGLVGSDPVSAHGGGDAAPAAPIATGGLLLPLDSQFLLDVRTAQVGVHPLEERVRALGTTVAPPGRHAEIHAPVTGVVSIPDVATLAPGSPVVAGQILANVAETLGGVDRSSVVDARTAAQVRLAQARSALALATRDQQQADALGDVLSGRERLARQQAVEVASSEVRQAEISASGVSGSVPTFALKSPITGRIAAMMARPGDLVIPGDPLFHVVGEGGLWVEARVPQTLAGHLQSGAAATIETDAQPGVLLSARVLDPGLEADSRTGTLVITLALDEAVPGLVPGMSVTASIVSGDPHDALTIPDSAVVDSGGESLVFVKTGPETFATRPVRLGERSADQREILEGIAAGERVVVQGTYPLRSLAGR